MKYLLDTHVWLWMFEASNQIPDDVAAILKDPNQIPLGIAAISPWEVVKKASLGRLDLSIPVRDWITEATTNKGIALLPLTPQISYEANYLPSPFHRDPADQIIVATARIADLTLVTCDRRILNYRHVRTLWGHEVSPATSGGP